MSSKQNAQEVQNDSIQAASEGVIQERVGDLVDRATRDLSKYVNTVAGDAVIAEPDNEVRRILVSLLLAYQERRKDDSSS